jgi:hypothetical protein
MQSGALMDALWQRGQLTLPPAVTMQAEEEGRIAAYNPDDALCLAEEGRSSTPSGQAPSVQRL